MDKGRAVSGGAKDLHEKSISGAMFANKLYLLIWLDETGIDRLEKPFNSFKAAKKAMTNLQNKITQFSSQREQVIGSPLQTFEEEDRGRRRWDRRLEDGLIDEENYNLSFYETTDLCIIHWEEQGNNFVCVCGRKGCRFDNSKPKLYPSV